MSQTNAQPKKPVRPKGAYHHGDLRQTLVDAARQLVIERGAENFTLSDACRLAGVSTAAPYKHFRDKDEILKAIVIEGFAQFTGELRAAVRQFPTGSPDSMVAMGQAYVAYARREPAIFRLMFGQQKRLGADQLVAQSGRNCFQSVVEDVHAFCAANGLERDAERLALEMWTLVHGAASLTIDQDYDKVAPGMDVDKLLADVTPRLFNRS
jgi:AcrR family transcriptional regulator